MPLKMTELDLVDQKYLFKTVTTSRHQKHQETPDSVDKDGNDCFPDNLTNHLGRILGLSSMAKVEYNVNLRCLKNRLGIHLETFNMSGIGTIWQLMVAFVFTLS